MPHTFWWLAVDALAVYRLAVLLSEDKITAWIRDGLRDNGYQAVIRIQAGEAELKPQPGITGAVARWLYELVVCPWCIGLWIAAPVVALTSLAPATWQYPAFGLALSGAAGFLAERTSH
jgi:Protein of unknown function (DUF1360)